MKISNILTNKLTTIASKLGDSDSLLPIFTKDVTQDTVTTLVYSKKGGEHDGREKAIEEYGTGVIWVAGIPVLKKIFDKTIYKKVGINPNIDVRKLDLKNPDNIKYSMSKLAKDSKEYLDLKKVLDHPKLAKGLFVSKFVLATAGTIGLLGALIHIKQNTTKKNIQKHIEETNNFNHTIESKIKKDAPSVFASFKGVSDNKNQPSFKGFLSSFMYNPVRNMSILDAAISGTRLKDARKGERGEVFFKEASAISFFYILGKPIQKGLEYLSDKVFKTPINPDIKTLLNPELESSIKNGSIKTAINEVSNVIESGDKQLLDFLWDSASHNNVAVKLLKETGAIPTLKNGVDVNPAALIEPKAIKEGLDTLSDFVKKVPVDKNLKSFMNKTKVLKTGSILANIGIAVAWLGLLQPLCAIGIRKLKNHGSSENPAVLEVKKNLEVQANLK